MSDYVVWIILFIILVSVFVLVWWFEKNYVSRSREEDVEKKKHNHKNENK